jgi:hypothetical protein
MHLQIITNEVNWDRWIGSVAVTLISQIVTNEGKEQYAFSLIYKFR